MILLQRQHGRGNKERYLATNKFAWQMIVLPRQDKRGNNVYSLATITFAWQMIYLPQHNGRGKNTLGNKILAWQQKSIATPTNVAITSYCNAWHRCKKTNSCNANLAMVASSYCNVTFCNHCQRTRFCGMMYFLQRNWACCNVLSSLRKG